MRKVIFALSFLVMACAHAGGGPSKLSCDRNTYHHFLDQGREVLAIENPDDFKRHWEGFVNRANTEWRDSLLACGYDPQDLRDNLETVKREFEKHVVAVCQDGASEARQKDYDRCDKESGKLGRESHRECLDRADKNFKDHLWACGGRDFSKAMGGDKGACDKGRCDKCPCGK